MRSIIELHHWRKLSLCLLGIFAFPLSHAEEPRNYQVEIVIFENLDPAVRQAEQWPTQSLLQLPTPLVELGSAADSKLGFRLIPASSFKLTQEAQQLADSHNYRILLHTAWRQPGLEQPSALPVHLTKTIPAASQPGVTNVAPPPGAPAASSKVLDGYLKLILSKYLHADVDLIYRDSSTVVSQGTAATTAPVAAAPLPVYELKQLRKMRSKELHYLDSPVLGMLIEVTPVAER